MDNELTDRMDKLDAQMLQTVEVLELMYKNMLKIENMVIEIGRILSGH